VVVLTLLSALVTGFLVLTRRFGAALFVICTAGGGQILNAVLKYLFGRERPASEFRWTEVHSLSFPSGHATSATVVYLAIAVLLARLATKTSHRLYIIGGAVLLSFLVGLTRVYLGVHYPSDVIAGWAVGIVWAQLCWFAARAIGRRRLARRAD
jgi:undecaprenyl-diphosphatase